MKIFAEIMLLLSVSAVLYCYIGYPLLLVLLGVIKKVPIKQENITPSLTLIIAAHNEEKMIRAKLENSLSLDYPADRLQIIVSSDASTDRTNEIAREYAGRGVQLYEQAERRGKSPALNHVVSQLARGEIIIFTDAPTMLQPDSLRKLVRNFADPTVGAVCAHLVFKNVADSDVSSKEGIYWRYESFLRVAEGEIGALCAVAGPFYGMRKSLYAPVHPSAPDDCVCPLEVIGKGYRVAFEPEAVGEETAPTTTKAELRVKVRGIARELKGISSRKKLLNPFRYPLVSLALVSHRILRYSVPFLLGLILLLNLVLLGDAFFRIIFWMQLCFYAAVGLGAREGLRKFAIFSFPYYFLIVNYAALKGVADALRGRNYATWEPVGR